MSASKLSFIAFFNTDQENSPGCCILIRQLGVTGDTFSPHHSVFEPFVMRHAFENPRQRGIYLVIPGKIPPSRSELLHHQLPPLFFFAISATNSPLTTPNTSNICQPVNISVAMTPWSVDVLHRLSPLFHLDMPRILPVKWVEVWS